MSESKSLIEEIESIQTMLIQRATGNHPGEEEYSSLRRKIINDERVANDQLPRFLRTCRSISEFWAYIQPKFSTYQERRDYVWAGFKPVLDTLENLKTSPIENDISIVVKKFDSESTHQFWIKALERRQTDPEGAITAARSLLESVCKQILEDNGESIKGKIDLPKLYKATAKILNIAPSQHSEQIFKQILGGCTSVVVGLGSIRNELSDAHGKGKKAAKPAPRHAELAVNLAGSMAIFLIATNETKNNTPN